MAEAFAFVGLVYQVVQSERQQKALENAQEEQEKQNAINNAQQAIARTRAINQSIAQTRVIQSEQIQAGFQSGSTGAASAAGGDIATAIGAAQTQEAAAFGISQSANREGRFLTTAKTGGSAGQISRFALAGAQAFKLYDEGAFDFGIS